MTNFQPQPNQYGGAQSATPPPNAGQSGMNQYGQPIPHQFDGQNGVYTANHSNPNQQGWPQTMETVPKKSAELWVIFRQAPAVVRVIPILLAASFGLLTINVILSWFQFSIMDKLDDDNDAHETVHGFMFSMGIPEALFLMLVCAALVVLYLAPPLRKYSWLLIFTAQVLTIAIAFHTVAIRLIKDESQIVVTAIESKDAAGFGDVLIVCLVAALSIAIIVMLFLKPVREWTNSEVEMPGAANAFGQQPIPAAQVQQPSQAQAGFASFPMGQQTPQSAQYPGAFTGNGSYSGQPAGGYQQAPQSGAPSTPSEQANGSSANSANSANSQDSADSADSENQG